MMHTRATTLTEAMAAMTPPKKRKFEGSSTLVKVGQVKSQKAALQIQTLEGLLHIVLQVPVTATQELEDDGGTVLDKIGNIRWAAFAAAVLAVAFANKALSSARGSTTPAPVWSLAMMNTFGTVFKI